VQKLLRIQRKRPERLKGFWLSCSCAVEAQKVGSLRPRSPLAEYGLYFNNALYRGLSRMCIRKNTYFLCGNYVEGQKKASEVNMLGRATSEASSGLKLSSNQTQSFYPMLRRALECRAGLIIMCQKIMSIQKKGRVT
jgi:hypothetical protein